MLATPMHKGSEMAIAAKEGSEMSDYAWFALKCMVIIAVIGGAVWVTETGWPLWALLLMPSWRSDDSTSK